MKVQGTLPPDSPSLGDRLPGAITPQAQVLRQETHWIPGAVVPPTPYCIAVSGGIRQNRDRLGSFLALHLLHWATLGINF